MEEYEREVKEDQDKQKQYREKYEREVVERYALDLCVNEVFIHHRHSQDHMCNNTITKYFFYQNLGRVSLKIKCTKLSIIFYFTNKILKTMFPFP